MITENTTALATFTEMLDARQAWELSENKLNDTKRNTLNKIAKQVHNETVAKMFTIYHVDCSFIVSHKRSTAMRNVYMVLRAAELASFAAGNIKLNATIRHIYASMVSAKRAGFDYLTKSEARVAYTSLKDEERFCRKDVLKVLQRYNSPVDGGTLNTQVKITIEALEAFNIVRVELDKDGEEIYKLNDNEHSKRFYDRCIAANVITPVAA